MILLLILWHIWCFMRSFLRLEKPEFYEYLTWRPITIIISTSSRIFGQTFFVHWGPFNPWKLDNCCEERELQLAAAMSDQRIPSTHHSLLLILNSQNFCWQHSRTRLHLLNQTRTKLSDLKLGWGVTPNNNIDKNKILWYYFVCVSTWKCFFFKFRKKKIQISILCSRLQVTTILLPIDTFQNSDYSYL